MLWIALGACFFLLWLFYFYKFYKISKYWDERDVVHVKCYPFVGSFKDALFRKKHLSETFLDIYNQFPNERCVGLIQGTKPYLMIRDLDLLKTISVKDFDHFHDHVSVTTLKSDRLMSKSLIALSGENWKKMRATLSPVFTSSKMKIIFGLMAECAENFVNHFKDKESISIDMKEVFSRFANDVIATTAFGVSINSLEDPKNDFFEMGSGFTKFGFVGTVKMAILEYYPFLAKTLKLEVFPRNLTKFFTLLIKENIRRREEEGIVRPDLIHILMEAKAGRLKSEDDEFNVAKAELTDEVMVAQALTFFTAGFDTVSTASSFMAYELAIHPEVQKKLQIEIDAVNSKSLTKVSYDTLLGMKYLDQVVSETLRKWPPGYISDRLCVKDYVIESKSPKEKVVFVEKGKGITIPIIGIHRDPKYFAEPNKFDPERFNENRKDEIVPGSYMPFGVGPRSCIASRFALLEIKTLFYYLLSEFIIIPVDETAIPIKLSRKGLKFEPENGFRLGLKRRTKK